MTWQPLRRIPGNSIFLAGLCFFLAPFIKPLHMIRYDVDAAAEVMAALYPHGHPREILRDVGIEGITSEVKVY